MMIDRERALLAFQKYTSKYDCENEKVRLKVEHTLRVCELCQRIAGACGWSEEEINLAWLLGVLHDVGRFEQIRRFGTFVDRESVDHAQLGAQILFEEGRIRDYLKDSSEDLLLKQAVASHSLYRLPEDLSERVRRFCQVLRDADKVDILKVNIDFPYEEIYNVTSEELRSAQVSPAVLAAFMEEHAVLHTLKRTAVDFIVGHVSLIYELVYPESRRIVREQGYLGKLLDFASDNEETREQFEQIRRKLEAYLAVRE